MDITEETLNHLLAGSRIESFNFYPPNDLHILLNGGTILALCALDEILDIDILGPDAPQPGDGFGIVEEISP